MQICIWLLQLIKLQSLNDGDKVVKCSASEVGRQAGSPLHCPARRSFVHQRRSAVDEIRVVGMQMQQQHLIRIGRQAERRRLLSFILGCVRTPHTYQIPHHIPVGACSIKSSIHSLIRRSPQKLIHKIGGRGRWTTAPFVCRRQQHPVGGTRVAFLIRLIVRQINRWMYVTKHGAWVLRDRKDTIQSTRHYIILK